MPRHQPQVASRTAGLLGNQSILVGATQRHKGEHWAHDGFRLTEPCNRFGLATLWGWREYCRQSQRASVSWTLQDPEGCG